MAKAILVKEKYHWKVETICPRCKKKRTEEWTSDIRYSADEKEFTCSKCGLIYKEEIYS